MFIPKRYRADFKLGQAEAEAEKYKDLYYSARARELKLLNERDEADRARAMAESPDRWELVSGNEFTERTYRLAVPGGWLYRHGGFPMVFAPMAGLPKDYS